MSYVLSGNLRQFENQWINGVQGIALLDAWHDFYIDMARRIAHEDPKRRVKWAGPSMSILSAVTARLMETWAHGQAVFDALGVVREEKDRIKNIAVLGINTFAWS